MSENNTYPSNSEKIKKHHVPGVIRPVGLKIVAGGHLVYKYKDFMLKQSVRGHHHFKLVLPKDALGENETLRLNKCKKMINQSILVTFVYKNIEDGPERSFRGVITKVRYVDKDRKAGDILLEGYSPTKILDKGKRHSQSFGGENAIAITDVVRKVLDQCLTFNSGFKYNIKSNKNFGVSYTAQYRETRYNYLCRLAASYGEAFFYDGMTLHFGAVPYVEKVIALVKDRDIVEMSSTIIGKYVSTDLYMYNSDDDEYMNAGAGTELKAKGTLTKEAYASSEKAHQALNAQVVDVNAHTSFQITDIEKGVRASEGIDVFKTSGTVNMPFLYPGCVVELNEMEDDKVNTTYFTEQIITKICHRVDALGNYTGTYEAVDAGNGCLPTPKYRTVHTHNNEGKVIDNADPQNKGRVRVQLPFHNGGDSTDWIRVMTVNAGGSGEVPTNRGIVFIPEIGDLVVVNYMDGHPDKAFVAHSSFTGHTGAGGGVDNHIKSIITESGVAIIIDDKDGKGSITIKDPSGNVWYMDGKGNVTVTAPETMTLNSKNLNINVAENMTTKVGMSKFDSIGMNSTESIGLVKTSNVLGSSNMLVVGELREVIKGNRHNEVEQGKTTINREGGLESNTTGELSQHVTGTTKLNSGEFSGS